MPNRIIKESVCSSDSIEQLSWFEEVMFYRLIVNCDDYGRLDARPAILKSRLFPLKERLSHKDIENALQKLSDIGCVKLYVCDNKPYLCLTSWEAHQSIRAKKSKYPDPATSDLQTSDNGCNQMYSDDCECHRNPIQSESNPNPNPNTDSLLAAEAATSRQAVIYITLNDKSEYPVWETQVAEWSELYPAVDVMQELREMRAWIGANPTKRKTKSGVLRFINTWLAKEQDKGRPPQAKGIKPVRSSEEYRHENDFIKGG